MRDGAGHSHKDLRALLHHQGVGKGTGLGLSTVYGIVHQSNGFIGVDSTLGQGTVFTIYLPRTAMAAETSDTQAGPESPARGWETILLVEDDDSARALISDVLKTHGYTILETGDPLEAIAIGERYPGPVHLLFTDVVMPGMRGHRAGRASPGTPSRDRAAVHVGLYRRNDPLEGHDRAARTLSAKTPPRRL
jgi:CheY-like chemotaxis protein